MERILDAAADIVGADGVAAVTMHRVAQRSRTTIGSMYHFFPDREAVLRTLALRHTQALHTLIVQTGNEGEGCWSHLTTGEAVDRFLGPFLGYVDRHPDLLPLGRYLRASGWHSHQEAGMDRLVLRLAETVIASRNPRLLQSDLAVRALTMTAMVEGVLATAASRQAEAEGAPIMAAVRVELRRALIAYLDCENAPAPCDMPEADTGADRATM